MRTANPALTNALQQQFGSEPILLVEVEWEPGQPILYSDQEFEGAKAILVSINGFDISKQLEGSSDTQSVTVTLDDTDGTLREIYTRTDVHMKTARVYLAMKTCECADEKMLLFNGLIVTPLEWPEGERTCTFSVLTKLTSVNVGFSMEEGEFPNIPEEALGQAWPLVFGQVCWLPAVRVRAPRRGYLLRGEGIVDFTLDIRICQALQIQCPSQSTGNQSQMLNGAYTTNQTLGPDVECVNRRFGEICKLRDLKTQQEAWQHASVPIYNGVSFPQGEVINLYADGAILRGTFSGNWFSVISRQHPNLAEWEPYACQQVDAPSYGYGQTRFFVRDGCAMRFYSINQGGYGCAIFDPTGAATGNKYEWAPTNNSQVAFASTANAQQEFETCDEALTSAYTTIGGPVDSWRLYDEMDEEGFAWLPAGTEVFMQDEAEELHIVSLIPGTVDGVAAYRTAANGKKYLTEVPASHYTVYETNYGGYTVVEIGLTKSLSLYDDGWDDQLYVSFTSDIGPNTCDIIEWIIEKYTNLTIDPTTFAAVKTKLTNYPQNFYLLDRPDALQLCRDLAYQARCALYVRNDVVYIKYLSEEPTSVRTLTESDILAGTLVEYLSETDEIYTSLTNTWQKAGAAVMDDLKVERKIILKYNVDKYGTTDLTTDYFSYNIYSLVLKSSTFWLIRSANCWRRLKFKLPLKHIDLDVGDCVTINIAHFSTGPVKCVIESTTYNPDENTVDVDCWTPIRSGEDSPFYWAWPAGQPAVARWPLPLDTHGGGGYSFAITPPIGHILLGGAHHEDQVVITTGDLNPSDLDDTFPTIECEILDYINFNEIEPEIEAKQIAQSAARSGMETTMGGGGAPGANSDSKKSVDECGKIPVHAAPRFRCSGIPVRLKVRRHLAPALAHAQAGARHATARCGGYVIPGRRRVVPVRSLITWMQRMEKQSTRDGSAVKQPLSVLVLAQQRMTPPMDSAPAAKAVKQVIPVALEEQKQARKP